FRQDLYYRINVVKIELPPLRERTSDIPILAGHFLEKYSSELGRQIVGFSPDAMDALRRYPFPGNVRELQNVVERAAVLTRGSTIGTEDLPGQVTGEADAASPLVRRLLHVHKTSAENDDADWVPMTLEHALREPEKRILLKALAANAWNRQKTADDLGINRTTLYKKMKALGIEDDGERRAG
ncbi:MAG: sigma-54-dependent Fis family transcriptional regulator, partial [Phycisphaerales bacterium]|nr:sigma-54-dependent Fis family transcriptional regulator [Phycisphaerales bacterium]